MSRELALKAADTLSPLARPRILVFAYAGEPGRGSEPGTGWGVIRAVAEFADCVVLVGPEHTSAIHRWIAAHADPATTFLEVPEPRGSSVAKRHRVSWFMLYLHWLGRAYRVGRELHKASPFNAIYHATYSTYWLPSPATLFDVPSVWGPVGGAVTTPFSLWPALGWRGIPGEILDWVAVRVVSTLPATRRTWRRATSRLVQNEATLAKLPAALRGSTRVLNHALFTEMPPVRRRGRGDYCLFVGSLEPRKGLRLAVRALAHSAPSVRLVVLGKGSERRPAERLASSLGVAGRIEFRGPMPREQVLEMLVEARAAVFTGLREEGGVALAEAMLCGTPIVVLANGGAHTLAAAATDPSRVALIMPGAMDDTARRIGEAMTMFSANPSTRTDSMLDQGRARQILQAAFAEALAKTAASHSRV
jgi:glycosyltransferase involved in cell wall biosynthesis